MRYVQDDKDSERRIPMNKGIAGYVIRTGQVVNIKNGKEHPAFDPDIDSRPKINCKWVIPSVECS
jgi:putative methionine-R-sulfoxide reductase with GAF domain